MIASTGARLARLLPPETAHTLTIRMLTYGAGVPPHAPDLPVSTRVELPRSGLRLCSPVGLAAGFDKNCEVPEAMAKFGFGFVECGTVTPKPQPGNPKPRLFRLTEDRAVINRMGFNNFGLDYFVRRLEKYSHAVPIGANVGANKDSDDRIGDYVTGIEAVAPHASYITINISSPNTPGLRGLQDKASLSQLLSRCGGADRKDLPVFLKLAPDLDAEAIADICSVVKAEGAWLSGLIISNTTLARPPSLHSEDKSEAGGLSGAPLLHPSTEVLRQFARTLDGAFDLIGAGGIGSGRDAYAKIRAGASAVQLYSLMVYEGPALAKKVARELSHCLAEDGYSTLADAVGKDL
ncbi:quinone-dependent dihydroorotate dehydrogenase [Hyphomonas sp. WL0036]|uniref:quinone-dependent dihydroorotate dehydrogenase n=1 Tax=Hyphomonas sediminis TaxID=2866160 RepID=UPI001C81D66E|nr:quinone-dependent dihydroorotate dehydrogenase [Hyphomonas sediminis]MBY9065852.1 quinone-dependent dihydroorotate dehydrogenase [Hyphomonas sediminis]